MSDQDNIRKLILNHNRRLQKLKERAAIQGITVDPSITIEIEDIEAKIENLKADLEKVEYREEQIDALEDPVDPTLVHDQKLILEKEIEDLLTKIKYLEGIIKDLEDKTKDLENNEDFSPLTRITISVFDNINQSSFFEVGERFQAGGMLIIPVWPDKAVQIKVSGAGHDERNAYITVSESGQITVESWNPSARPIETQIHLSVENWPHKHHFWKFKPLNLKQVFRLEDGVRLIDSNIITAACWIWHKARGRVDEEFLILVGKT